MQLYLIRHAESENNARHPSLRVEDPPITELGHLQAGHLAAWLQTLPMDVLITSPVRRALQTTRYVRETTGQHVHVWANVFEEGGIYRGHGPEAIEGGPGLTRSEVLDHIAESAAQCTLDDVISSSGWWGSKPRESSEAAAARAREVVGRLTQTFRDGHVVVMIIHADLKRRLLVEMIGEDHNPQIFGKLRNVGITKLDYVNDRWQLDWFNSVSHLPAQLITGNE